MPRTSRQDRYETLRLPENVYDTMNPHPQAQTVYSYPIPTLYVYVTLFLSLVPGVVTAAVLKWERGSVILVLVLFGLALLFFIFIHPAIGITKRRLVDTPNGYQTVYVHRPFVARRQCEKGYGVTGGNPYKQERVFFSEKTVRYEPAFWVVDW